VSRGRLVAALLLVVLAGAAAVPLLSALPPGRLRYTDRPVVVLPLAPPAVPEDQVGREPEVAPSAADAGAMLAAGEPPLALEPEPSLAVDPALVELAPVGKLPRIAADGRTPLQAFARRSRHGCATPCAAVIVTGLGLAEQPSVRALALPPEIGLSFSPYADRPAVWQARARAGGHEVLLDLPLQPPRFPRDDGGPLMIPLVAPLDDQEQALLRVLATGSFYLGVAAAAEGFAAEPARFAPIARALQARGVGFVELGGEALRQVAEEAGLAYVPALGRLDPLAERGLVDLGLDDAEARAAEAGWAMAFVPVTPVNLDRLADWLEALPAKGVSLVSPGELLDRASNKRETVKR
jgi:polysaccharide deacetylase 2 family uncharacterized protein YibQ